NAARSEPEGRLASRIRGKQSATATREIGRLPVISMFHRGDQETMERITELSNVLKVSSEIRQPRVVPKHIAAKCPGCKEIIFERSYKRNLKMCPHCQYHFKLRAHERIELLVDT